MKRIFLLLISLFYLVDLTFAQTTLWTLIGTNNNQAKGYGPNIGRSVSTVGGPVLIANGYGGAGFQPWAPNDFYFISATNWQLGGGTKAWKITVNTTYFNNITISYAQGSQYQSDANIGPKNFKLQYSIDDVNYYDVTGTIADLGYDNWNSAAIKTNIALPADCANKSAVYLKWIMTDDAGTGNHILTSNGESWLANIEVKGNAFVQVAPTKILLSNNIISTFSPINTLVGTLSCDDPNPGDVLTYTLASGGADNGSFSISGNELRNAVTLTERNYNIRINVNDGTANYAQNFTINATDYPVITGASSDDWITNVTFNTINSASAKDADGYGNYKSRSTTLTRLSSYNLSVTNAINYTDYPQYLKAWIDWNHNGSFNDPGEEYTLSTNISSGTTTIKSITVPGDAYPGSTCMRVVLRGANTQYTPTPPVNAGNNGCGEAEDYTLNITGPAVTFTNGSSFSQSFTPGNTNQVIGMFKLTGSIAGTSLTAASIKLNGVRTGLSNFKLWSSSDASFGGDTQIGSTVAADPGDGNSVTFSSLSSSITTSGVYYFLTADLAFIASGNVQGVIVQNSSLSIYYGVISGTITNAAMSNSTMTIVGYPGVTSTAVTILAPDAATLGGNVTSASGGTVTERGVVYSTTDATPTIGESGVIKDINGSGTGTFSKSIGSLTPVTLYHFQAYATNATGTSYGGVIDFTTESVTLTFTDGSALTQSFTPGNSDQVIGNFELSGNTTGSTLTNISIKLNGTRTGLSNFKLWSSTDNTFSSDTQLGSTVAADPGDGNSISFSFTSSISTTGLYYFITADVSSSASGNVQGVIVQNSSLTVTSGIISGTISNAVLSNGTSPLPVELTSFTAAAIDKGVELKWETATEQNNYGFEVERQVGSKQNAAASTWEKIGSVDGHGTINSPNKYSFIDTNPLQGNAEYRLKQIDLDGNYKYYSQIAEVIFSMTDVKEKQLPTKFELSQNYPNPFNPSTVISYQLPVTGNVVLKVYDMLGNEVSTLVNEFKQAGYYQVELNASNFSTGVYLYKITAGGFTLTKKMILMK